jgi:predicted MFS family arabinose efflux permease
LLLAEVGRRVPFERRAMAFGVVSAGGSAGQLLFGPGTQAAITGYGLAAALTATAIVGLLAWPLALSFEARTPSPKARDYSVDDGRVILGSPEFWLIGGSYAVCGFHVGYVTTHMPGVIERCGLPPSLAGTWLVVMGLANIAGSLGVAWWLRRHSTHAVLMAIYLLRGAAVALLIALPPTPALLLGFAVLMGFTYMALLPAISHQVAERFGVARIATLFGGVALLHQLGSFAGTWLGGVVAAATGGDSVLWSIDIVLAVVAVAMQWRLGRPFAPRASCAVRPA